MRTARAGAHLLEHRVRIRVPRGEVWRLVEEPDALMQWVEGLRSVSAPGGAPGGFSLGATFVQRVRIGPVGSTCHGEVTAFEAPSRLSVMVRHRLFELGMSYAFVAEGRRTEVHCAAAVEGGALGAVLSRGRVEDRISELLVEHLEALRSLAEGGGGR